MAVINVQLYGGKSLLGGRESPLEADVISCDRYEKCSLYKKSKCLKCRSFLGNTCKFGNVSTHKGYTSRAMKYYTFKHKWESDEAYNKLSYPANCKVAVVDDYIFLDPTYVDIRKIDKEDISFTSGKNLPNGYRICDPKFGCEGVFIPKEDFTPEFLYEILTYKPYAIMGGVIKSYATEKVPEILYQLRKELPDFHKEFVSKYPQFDISPNYIGKKAFVKSLKPGTKFLFKNLEWTFTGDKVVADGFDLRYYNSWYGVRGHIEAEVTDKMTIEINDNSIVDEDTVFEE